MTDAADRRAQRERATALYPPSAHGMPKPTWATRGLPDDSDRAWEELARTSPHRAGAISIYVHLPFCDTRCPFCDCRAVALPRGSREPVRRYVDALCRETAKWATLPGLAIRPVTTVHFGGGTPLALHADEFERMVRAIQDAFGASGHAEWAIESTSRRLDDEHLELLVRLGFRRVHVGVQTLQPRLRAMLGRRESAETVLARIATCLGRECVVSADLLYGLPGQSAGELLDDVDRIIEVGIHGVSLYHLNHGSHNDRFIRAHGLAARDEARLFADFCLFGAAADRLESLGYRKNHFAHFARPEDGNLYSRHAVRGEDLIALGATADGVLGQYYYRHSDVGEYGASDTVWPPLLGGYYTPAEQRARPLVANLMAGEIAALGLDEVALRYADRLIAAGLLVPVADGRAWRLTSAGSWCAGAAAEEAWRLYRDEQDRTGPSPWPE